MCKFHLQPKLRLIWDVKCSSLNLLLIVWTPHWTWLQNLKKFLKYNTVPKYGSSISHEAKLKIWESYRVVVTVNCCFKCWFYDQSSMWLSFMRFMTRLVQTMVMLSPEEGVMWSLTMPYLDILQEKNLSVSEPELFASKISFGLLKELLLWKNSSLLQREVPRDLWP